MELKPIRTKTHYAAAIREARRLFDSEPGSPAHDRLEVLAILIDDYETRHFPIEAPDPVAAVEFVMEQKGYTKSDLGKVLGSASRASEILRRRRRLTVPMIHALSSRWGIPAEILIRPYARQKRAA